MTTKKVSKKGITKKAAAQALYDLARNYEKVSFATVYRNCYWSPQYGCWRYIGKAHDYSF